jgi:Bacterial RNA polymerase, alpha chain C terminal domain
MPGSALRMTQPETTRVVIWNSASLDACGPLDRDQIVEALNALGITSLDALNGTPLGELGPARAVLEEMLLAYDFGAIVCGTLPVSAYSLESLNRIPVSALYLSTRPQNCLSDAGFTNVGQLPLRRVEALLGLSNMGRKSLIEIYRKINAVVIGHLEQAQSGMVRLPLGALMHIADWQPLEDIADNFSRHRNCLIGELAVLQSSEVRSALRLSEEQWFGPQCQLLFLGLELGAALPSWFKMHSSELRAAFAPEMERLLGGLPKFDLPSELREDVSGQWPSPAEPPGEAQLKQVYEPRCLEDEFLTYLKPGISATKQDIVAKVLGWDGGDGGTLEDVGSSVGLTRERIRQIVFSSVKKPDAIDTRFLRRAISEISRSVPISLRESAGLLQRVGITNGKLTARQIQKTAEYFGLDTTWFIEKYRNEYLVVDEASRAVIRDCQSEAFRRIGHFGVTSVQHVSKKLGRDGNEVRLYCSLIDGMVWLDEDRCWFWAPSARNAIAGRLAKILEAVVRVRVETAHQAILRDRRMAGTELPVKVFRAVCGHFGWCRIDEDEIVRIGNLPEAEQDTNETKLVSVLREHGPVLERGYLCRLATQAGISEASFNMLLSFSPLIVRLGESLYGVIGSALDDLRKTESEENLPIANDDSVRRESEGTDLLAGCNPQSPAFPRQALARAA